MSPGQTLRDALKARGWSQGQLALELGIRKPTSICLILSGRRRLTPKMAARLGLALKLDEGTVSELVRSAADAYIKI